MCRCLGWLFAVRLFLIVSCSASSVFGWSSCLMLSKSFVGCLLSLLVSMASVVCSGEV